MAQRFFEGVTHAAAYAKFRPQPPASLVESVMSAIKNKVPGQMAAADIGCGSGQGTQILASYFDSVSGVDVSQSQISEAKKMNKQQNVSYSVSPAETLPYPEGSLNLVISGQACHWFDLPMFYKEVDRILRPGGVLALYGYSYPRPVHGHLSQELHNHITHVYANELGDYWGDGLQDVDSKYTDEKFTIPYPDFTRDDSHYVDQSVSVDDLLGYFRSWSGFQNFQAKNGEMAAQRILDDFNARFMGTLGVKSQPEETMICIRFCYFLLMGSKPTN